LYFNNVRINAAKNHSNNIIAKDKRPAANLLDLNSLDCHVQGNANARISQLTSANQKRKQSSNLKSTAVNLGQHAPGNN